MNRDYIIENVEDAFFIVKIIKGDFNNIMYKYDRISVDHSSYLPKLSFHYTIIGAQQYSLKDLQESEEFVTLMGDILTDLILRNEDAFRKHNYKESYP